MDMGRRLDGRPAVGLDIFKERNANLVEVVARRAGRSRARSARSPALSGIQIKVIDNQADSVTSSLMELAEAGGIGLLLSIAVLFFFLRHWPSTLMVTLAIPICFVMTLGFMYFFGVTLNILSMMGLLLAVGMLVDNAVVVVESIYQDREKMPGRPDALASIDGHARTCRSRCQRRHPVPLHRVPAEPVRRDATCSASTCRRSRSRSRCRCWPRGWSRSA